MSKLLSDEELLWHIRKTKEPHYACEFKQDNTYRKTVKCSGCLHSLESARNAENALLDLINTQKRLYAESVEVDVRLDEINRAVSHKYEHPSGRFIGRGKYYGMRTDELDAELRAEQRARVR